MTYQTTDLLDFNHQTYRISGFDIRFNTQSFDILKYDFSSTVLSTAHQSSRHLIYEIKENQLFLKEVVARRNYSFFEYPNERSIKIDHIIPKINDILPYVDEDINRLTYCNIDLKLDFTGELVIYVEKSMEILADVIESHLLTFKNGNLVSHYDQLNSVEIDIHQQSIEKKPTLYSKSTNTYYKLSNYEKECLALFSSYKIESLKTTSPLIYKYYREIFEKLKGKTGYGSNRLVLESLRQKITDNELPWSCPTSSEINIFYSYKHDEFIKFKQLYLDVIQLFAQGYTTKEVGKKLFHDPQTIITIRKNLLTITGIKNFRLLLVELYKQGLIKLEDID